MKIVAKKDRKLLLINTGNTQNENKAETIELTVPEEYEDYNKKIVFVTDDGIVWDIMQDNTYKLTKAITKYKQVDFYIWLTKGDVDFRTETRSLRFYHNEDASDEITPEEISGVNTVVNLLEEEIEKVENLNIEATKIGSTTTVTITKKDGTTESVEINDGVDGKDAKINGKNSIEIEAGNNITIDNTENGIRINSTGGGSGGTSNYNDLSNKPKINNVELSGNKSLNDLGIQPKGNYIEDNNYVHTDNNFNNTYKNKLEGLENYDDTEVKEDIADIQDEQTEQNTDIEKLQTENARLKATLPTTTGEGQDVTLNKTAELEFIKPPLPMGNSEQVQTTQSANLFDEDYYKTATYETAGSVQYIPLKIKGGRYLVFKTTLKNGGETVSGAYMYLSNIPHSTQGEIIYAISNGTPITRSLDFTATDLYLNIMGNIEDIFNNYNIMIATTDTSYVPFVPDSPSPDYPQEITNVTGDIEVVVGNIKNFLDWNKFSDLSNWEDALSSGYKSFKIENLKPLTTYTFCRIDNSGEGQNIYAGFNSTNNNTNIFISHTDSSKCLKSISAISTEEGVLYVTTTARTEQYFQSFLSCVKDAWVIEGTDYVEHKEQVLPLTLGNIELCKIGDYQDYFYKQSNKWYLHKEIGKVVLNGSETWYIGTYAPANSVQFITLKPNNFFIETGTEGLAKIKSSHFINQDKVNGMRIGYNMAFFPSNNYNITTVEDFKTWLSTHNTIVYYVLATPTNTEITDTTLISQLEAINDALSYEEQTNISSNQNALFDVEAYLNSKVILAEKYVKPSTGIPKADLASDVQTSLGKADTALQSHQDISGKLDTSKVKNTNSTTAGDVYDVMYINTMLGDIDTILTRLTTGSGV